jgi:hypothetical protein
MSTITVTIKDKTSGNEGMYSVNGNDWFHIPSTPIPVSNQIFIKLNTDENFTICFNMDGSSTNVMFTAEFMGTNIWKLSNITGDTLSVTIKDPA